MNVVQIGANEGNDELSELIKGKKISKLILIEPLDLHNPKLRECYSNVENLFIENVAITDDPDQKEISFFFHREDFFHGWTYQKATLDRNHLLKHELSEEGIVEIKVPSMTLNELLQKYDLVDVDILFIYAEGFDHEIITSLDFDKFNIKHLYFENLHLKERSLTENFIVSKNFEIVNPAFGTGGWSTYAINKNFKSKMKIGVLLTCYNCEEYVDSCLNPWIKLRERMSIVIACNSGMFRDYFDLGISENNEKTLEKLISHKLDFLVTTSGKNLLDEDSSRNLCLDFLNKQACDLLIYLDGDEIYTEKQILDVLEFVENNSLYDGYKVCFKNHTIRKGLFLNNFIRDSIFWLNRYQGIQRFYFDTEFVYNDPNANYSNRVTIPREVAFVEHYSWLSDDPRTKIKIVYQENRYCGSQGQVPVESRCAYKFDVSRETLTFNDTFYAYYGEQIPILREIGEIYSFDLELNFNRGENIITIHNHRLTGDFVFEVKDYTSTYSYGTYLLNLHSGVNYWINPSGSFHFDSDENFLAFRVRVTKEEVLIHDEFLYLKS